jgi:hypothetical protein
VLYANLHTIVNYVTLYKENANKKESSLKKNKIIKKKTKRKRTMRSERKIASI